MEGPEGVKARVAVYQASLDGHWDALGLLQQVEAVPAQA